jgi:hypothetical protein
VAWEAAEYIYSARTESVNNSYHTVKFIFIKVPHATKHLFHHGTNALFHHTTCGIHGQVGIIFFNNTSGQLKFWFTTIINYYKGNGVLALRILVILLHMCMHSTDCCAVVRSVQVSTMLQYTAWKTRAASAQPSLRLMASGWLQRCAEIQVLTPLRWMVVCSECLTLYVTWPPDWPFCDQQLSEACHCGGTSDHLCTTGQSGTQSCKRAVSELQYAVVVKLVLGAQLVSGREKRPQTQHEVPTIKLQFASQRQLLQIACQPGASYTV